MLLSPMTNTKYPLCTAGGVSARFGLELARAVDFAFAYVGVTYYDVRCAATVSLVLVAVIPGF